MNKPVASRIDYLCQATDTECVCAERGESSILCYETD